MSVARVYEYGLLPPTANAALVDEQIRAAHRYRNLLIEIERERRAAIAAVLAGHPDIEALAAEVTRLSAEQKAAREAIKRTRAVDRARSETVQQRGRVKEISAALRLARERLKAAKIAIYADPIVQAGFERVEAAAADRVRAARAACGVYWGSYLLAEQAADQARKSRTPPSFRPWRGEGAVSVQLQGGIALDELWGTDTQIQIVPVPATAYDEATSRGDQRGASARSRWHGARHAGMEMSRATI